jgi:hypothetical protein
MTAECPSATYRQAADRLLTKAAALGPITSENRSATDEFKRVYKFLHFNEPGRIDDVLEELLARLQRPGAQRPSTRNAWNYVVGAFDQWMMRARVFYLSAGLVEGALRSRLNAILTDEFGKEWPSNDKAVPSVVSEQLSDQAVKTSLQAVQRVLDAYADTDLDSTAKANLRAAMALQSPTVTKYGDQFVLDLTFGQLRSFFQTKRLWGSGPRLSRIFLDVATREPPLKGNVDKALETIQKARNDVAHYRPSRNLNFSSALYECARLAEWIGVDLQHFYGSVDTRASTELSVLASDVHARSDRATRGGNECKGPSCSNGEPFDLMFSRAPKSDTEANADSDAIVACAYHRVVLRARHHGRYRVSE